MTTKHEDDEAAPTLGLGGAVSSAAGANASPLGRIAIARRPAGAPGIRRPLEINLVLADRTRLTATRKARGPATAGGPAAAGGPATAGGPGSARLASARQVPPSARKAAGESPRSQAGDGDFVYLTVPTDQLLAFRSRCRKPYPERAIRGLAAAMRQTPWRHPILVRPHPRIARHYEVVVGDLAFQAARSAGLAHMPVAVCGLSHRRALECAILEDVRRPDLTPREVALGYAQLIARSGYGLAQLARLTGRSDRQVAGLLRLLLQSPAPSADGPAANLRPPRPSAPGAAVAALKSRLSERLGAAVEITGDGRTGAITITFESVEQFETIARQLSAFGPRPGPRTGAGRASPGLAA